MDLGSLLPYLAAVGGIGLLLVLIGALFAGRAAKKEGNNTYRIDGPLLSKAERSFYGVLSQALEGEASTVFAKVRVADVLKPAKGLRRGAWQSAFNAISSKHFDFVVCSSTYCSVQMAVELDDASHDKPDRKKRDALLNSACESAGLPLLRFQAARGYSVTEVRQQLAKVLRLEPLLEAPVHDAETGAPAPETPPPDAPPLRPTEPAAATAHAAPQSADSPSTAAEQPSCSKCGAAMQLTTPDHGKLAGQTFWLCSTYPSCRGAKHLPPDKAAAH